MKLSEAIKVEKDLKDADFWIYSRGPDMGKPTMHYEEGKNLLGVKVIKADVFDPKYLYYVFEYCRQQGWMVGTRQHLLFPDDVKRVLDEHTQTEEKK